MAAGNVTLLGATVSVTCVTLRLSLQLRNPLVVSRCSLTLPLVVPHVLFVPRSLLFIVFERSLHFSIMAAPQPAPTQQQSGSRSASSSTLSIPISAAAGGVTITQPPQTATSFYKIASGQLITFGWNFTDVLATPTHLTVSAVCANGNTYPVGPTNGIIPGTATTVVWDPFSYDQSNPNTPLAQASYTLHIWDDRGPNAARRAGFMQPNSALQFALYTPQPYTPINSGNYFVIHLFV